MAPLTQSSRPDHTWVPSTRSTGSQASTLRIDSTGNHVGGTFVITENTGSRNVTGITITENGTVDAANNLDNIKLYYDLDTSSPDRLWRTCRSRLKR